MTPAPDVTAPQATQRLFEAWEQVRTLARRFADAAADRLDLPPHQMHSLTAVGGGATRIHEIATATTTSVSAASRTVDGLVRDGLLDRARDPDDRRASLVTLTDAGERVLADLRGWAGPMVQAVVEELGADRAGRLANDLAAFTEGVAEQLSGQE